MVVRDTVWLEPTAVKPAEVVKTTHKTFRYYVVKPKDTYYSISRQLKIPVKTLQQSNGNKELRPGDTIRIN